MDSTGKEGREKSNNVTLVGAKVGKGKVEVNAGPVGARHSALKSEKYVI